MTVVDLTGVRLMVDLPSAQAQALAEVLLLRITVGKIEGGGTRRRWRGGIWKCGGSLGETHDDEKFFFFF
jgi:hypothetical protein